MRSISINKGADNKSRLLLPVLALLFLLCIVSNSVLVCRVTVVYLALLCALWGRKEQLLINPFYLFFITPFSLLLYFDLGGIYMLPLSFKTWMLAIINISAFILALKYTPHIKKDNNFISSDSFWTVTRLTHNALILFSLSLLSKLIPELAAVMWMFGVAGIVCALKTRKKAMIALVLLYMVLDMTSGSTSKMQVLLHCLTVLICYRTYYVSNKNDIVKLIIIAIAAIGLMVFAFTFANKERGTYNSEEGLEYYSRTGLEWNLDASLFLPYMYLETPWTNLEYVVNTQDTRTSGLWMIKPFIGYFGIDDDYKEEYQLVPYSSFNTFTFISVHFKDWGYWLSIISSILLGFFVKKVYHF